MEIIDILSIIANTTVIYIVVLIGLRILGKKDLGQVSVTDILFIMLVSEAVGDVMRASHDTLTGGLVSAVTLIALNKLFNIWLFKSKKMRQLVEGEPAVLIRHGKVNVKEMKRNRITIEELEQAGRGNNKGDISEIALAILEVDGKISILDKDTLKTKETIKE